MNRIIAVLRPLLVTVAVAGFFSGWTADRAAAQVTEPAVSSEATARGSEQAAAVQNRRETTAPEKAYALLQRLQDRAGKPLAGYIGGREFQNRERRLPRGRYREYDVNRKRPGRPRDAERIVIEQHSGKAYYTGDHYRTFIPLN